jgi:hypothetical protein
MLHRRQFLIALGGAVACARPVCRDPGPGGSAAREQGPTTSNQMPEWLQPIWNGFGPRVVTRRPLLKVFHSAQAWQRFIEPLSPDPASIASLDGFDWSQWVLMLMLAPPAGGMETRLVVRKAIQESTKVIIGLDVELEPGETAGLDIEMQTSMLAKGSRKVFGPEVPVEFDIVGNQGVVTHD